MMTRNNILRSIYNKQRSKILLNSSSSSFFSSKSATFQYILDDNQYDNLKKGDPPPRDLNIDYKGWNLAMKRSRDIIEAISEKEFNKALHIYCHQDFLTDFGKSKTFTFGGCTDNQEDYDATKDLLPYRDGVELVDFTKQLPYGSREFHFVVSTPHPVRNKEGPIIPIREFARLINEGGHGIYAYPASVWRKELLLDQILEADTKGILKFINLSYTELDEFQTFYYACVIKGGLRVNE